LPAAVSALLARGDELIRIGDIAAGRLVYQRAATLGSGQAATAAGRTYDPRFLRQIGTMGVVADPEAAAAWYRKGAALGDRAAQSLLNNLEPANAR
jgi:TPR repeat protein